MELVEFRRQLEAWISAPAWHEQLLQLQAQLNACLAVYDITGTAWEAEGPAQLMQTQYPTQLVHQWVRWLALEGELSDLRIRMHMQLTWPEHVTPGPVNALLVLSLQRWPDASIKFIPVLSGVIDWKALSGQESQVAVLDWLSPPDLNLTLQKVADSLHEEFRP